MTPIRYLLQLLGKILSLLVEGVFFIVSLWFLIGLLIFGLIVVIAFMYGIRSLF